MKRIVDIYRKGQGGQMLWTYIVILGGNGSHPSLVDFKNEALRLAVLDNHDLIENLDAYVHLEIIQ